MSRDSFSTYNPILTFAFFIGAIAMGMFFIHPVFTGCSIVCSLIYWFSIKGTGGLKMLMLLTLMFILLSVINPLFNHQGSIILFKIFGAPYTLEALIYGMSLAGMVVSTLCWFACYNAVMTSDKFIYLFGKMLPTISLILSMILRLIPAFRRKASQISTARGSIGMAGSACDSKRQRIRSGAVTLNILTTWALEDGIVTADSMKCRGYGSGRRSHYAQYSFDMKNIVCTSVMAVLAASIILCAAMGGMKAVFTPSLDIAWFGSIWMCMGHILYTCFMLIPAFINIKETIVWHVLRSGI